MLTQKNDTSFDDGANHGGGENGKKVGEDEKEVEGIEINGEKNEKDEKEEEMVEGKEDRGEKVNGGSHYTLTC